MNAQSGKSFVELSGVSGLDSLADARTHVRFDFDRNGYPDIAIVNANAPFLNIFRNQLGDHDEAARFIALRFHGGNRTSSSSAQWSTRDGYGATVRLRVADQTLLREHRAGEGFAGQNSATMLIGLGRHERADSIDVHWPSGRRQHIGPISAGLLLDIYEDPSEVAGQSDRGFTATAYRPVDRQRRWAERHTVEQLPIEVDRTAQLSVYVTVATWCQNCRNSVPRLRELLQSLSPNTVATFGIPIDPQDTRQKLEQWQAQYKPPLRLLSDLSADQRKQIRELLKQRATSPNTVPSTIITDKNGVVRAVFPGPPTLSQIRELLDI